MKPGPTANRGENRLLLVFAASDKDEKYVRQRDLLQDQQAAFEDRDLIPSVYYEGNPTADAARKQFGIEAGDFAVVLVGKDGGEKFRSAEPVRPRDLFDRIDAMPMRRREVQNKTPR